MVALKNKLVIKIFSFIWKKQLSNWWAGKSAKVIKVTGWRNALVDDPCGHRLRITGEYTQKQAIEICLQANLGGKNEAMIPTYEKRLIRIERE
jgi:hypothetical protein